MKKINKFIGIIKFAKEMEEKTKTCIEVVKKEIDDLLPYDDEERDKALDELTDLVSLKSHYATLRMLYMAELEILKENEALDRKYGKTKEDK